MLWSFWNVKSEMRLTSAVVTIWNSIRVSFSSPFTTQGFLPSPTTPRKDVSPFDKM